MTSIDKAIVISGTHCITHRHANMLKENLQTILTQTISTTHNVKSNYCIISDYIYRKKINISSWNQGNKSNLQ